MLLVLLVGSVAAQDRLEGDVAIADLPVRLEGATAHEVFAYTSARAGDVDGDGFDDVWIAPSHGDSGGSAILYRGPLAGTVAEADASLLVSTGSADDGCGLVSGGADLDGDGIPDGVMSCEGGVYVLPGGLTGVTDPSAATAWFLPDTDGVDDGDFRPGFGIATPDITGDGQPDLLLAGSLYQGERDNGVVLVLPGPLGGELAPTDAAAQVARNTSPREEGFDARSDVDGDGVSDLLTVTWNWRGNELLVLFLGPLDGRVTLGDAALRVHLQIDGWSGRVVDDTNGDGTPDLLVGAPLASADRFGGAAFLLSGTDRGDEPPVAGLATFLGTDAGDDAGRSVAGADLDQDGFGDVAVGAPDGGEGRGEVGVWYGPVTGTLPLWTADLRVAGDGGGAGWWMDSPGDLDGDLFPDLLLAAPGWSDGAAEVGAAFLLPGGGAASP